MQCFCGRTYTNGNGDAEIACARNPIHAGVITTNDQMKGDPIDDFLQGFPSVLYGQVIAVWDQSLKR